MVAGLRMLLPPEYDVLTATDFLDFRFGDRKAELDNGVIRLMAGVTGRHGVVAGNILSALAARLRGSGFGPYTSAMAVQTHALSVRRPDISVFPRHGSEDDDKTAFDNPVALFEIASAGHCRTDLHMKLDEYRAVPSVDTIVLVDIATERVRVIQRTGPHDWTDVAHDEPVDIPLPMPNLTLPHTEMFARD
ncbi:Uma2 family endonuclease [Sphingomonas sp. KR1UV-12]|uniref:Uma2 family endonuclease n=1 Tax=Sphingomonas aurea TaxID=3063994 RepID=A0ABT9EFN1_9SPHN|nr:Uma2 family endonuclease [Sphingomonas sp. KR1UV-12]MDP1025779.1 Uma2 family endonuclease [Sphingomonas sp. KR1UV-12]